MMELLSPAGGWEAMVAAVQNGADAVYMGFGGLNARRSARNFTDEEFREAVAYCHLRGVKVYLTLNTLVTDRELPAAAEALKKASDMGVDAILIQDWGIWRLAREIAPDVPLHASTQMSLHTLGGACRAAELGLERVVLARELSRRDIHTITRDCPAEIEVFGHGALCMCYSGQCEMSAVIGGRSGNRGACAQPCRLPYGVNEKAAGGHPLSLKDANLADYVQELEQMGVACLKLEGRMKRPEYVAVITGIYRRLLDEKRGPSREESRQLEAAFSRSGFTDGYYKGRTGPEMFGTRPENAPEPKELFARAKAGYSREDSRRVPVDMVCTLRAGEPVSLTASAGGHVVRAEGPTPEEARNRALTAEELQSRLEKTGGTVFRPRETRVELEEGLMLPASAVNALRRQHHPQHLRHLAFAAEVSEETELSTEEWDVSRSKTATELNELFESQVTLSLPSAEKQLVTDVVLVLDKSTSTDLENQVLNILEDLKSQIEGTGAKINVGVVIFNKVANVKFHLREANSMKVAEYAIHKLENGKFYIVPGFDIKLARFFAKITPNNVLSKITYRIQKRKIQ